MLVDGTAVTCRAARHQGCPGMRCRRQQPASGAQMLERPKRRDGSFSRRVSRSRTGPSHSSSRCSRHLPASSHRDNARLRNCRPAQCSIGAEAHASREHQSRESPSVVAEIEPQHGRRTNVRAIAKCWPPRSCAGLTRSRIVASLADMENPGMSGATGDALGRFACDQKSESDVTPIAQFTRESL